jgi:predicted HTH domain antitoxin
MPAIQMESEPDYSLIINVIFILIAIGLILIQYIVFTSHVEIIQSDLEDHILTLRERVDALEVELYGEEDADADQSSNVLTVNHKED